MYAMYKGHDSGKKPTWEEGGINWRQDNAKSEY